MCFHASRLHDLIAVAVLVTAAASCRHAAETPTLWSEARPTVDASYLVGEVRSNRDGEPLESTVLRLLSPDGDTIDSALTESQGAFVIGPVRPGPYHLRVHMIAHRPVSQTLELHAGAVDTVRFRLTYDTTGLIADCIGPERPDGTRGFGSQFCLR